MGPWTFNGTLADGWQNENVIQKQVPSSAALQLHSELNPGEVQDDLVAGDLYDEPILFDDKIPGVSEGLRNNRNESLVVQVIHLSRPLRSSCGPATRLFHSPYALYLIWLSLLLLAILSASSLCELMSTFLSALAKQRKIHLDGITRNNHPPNRSGHGSGQPSACSLHQSHSQRCRHYWGQSFPASTTGSGEGDSVTTKKTAGTSILIRPCQPPNTTRLEIQRICQGPGGSPPLGPLEDQKSQRLTVVPRGHVLPSSVQSGPGFCHCSPPDPTSTCRSRSRCTRSSNSCSLPNAMNRVCQETSSASASSSGSHVLHSPPPGTVKAYSYNCGPYEGCSLRRDEEDNFSHHYHRAQGCPQHVGSSPAQQENQSVTESRDVPVRDDVFSVNRPVNQYPKFCVGNNILLDDTSGCGLSGKRPEIAVDVPDPLSSSVFVFPSLLHHPPTTPNLRYDRRPEPPAARFASSPVTVDEVSAAGRPEPPAADSTPTAASLPSFPPFLPRLRAFLPGWG
ncbi:unnamed protein product [Cyprideis torosa]|uniref:Uncharacterized protein n=1 Tax=Cyprideis torosa TaxID=163714 RepID=A0A7R8W4S8_9CRUS|nr:unnamed protein product [Cyprideis torosa]CAG0882146.1 unnamed protein product [Cyprideis torosa]